MACREVAQFFLGKTQYVDHFILFALVVGIEGPLQVVADTHIIDDKTLILRWTAHTVHTGDCLEEAVRDDDLIES